ncbi:MAG: DeoR family transcriptional regulator [Oscillospiraceae bacterium]|nr:DeoR family transcriptional regulator [Oscillospiraceae bacterium]
MSIIERREEIIRIMIAKRKSTVPQLAVDLNVSTNTIRRDITALTSDYPLNTVSGNGGGVVIDKNYHPYKNVLTSEQTHVLEEIMNSTSNAHHREVIRQMLAELTSKICRQKYAYKEELFNDPDDETD